MSTVSGAAPSYSFPRIVLSISLALPTRAATARRVEPEYLELRSAHDLSEVERVNGTTLLAVAARVGGARLIDNAILGGEQRWDE